MKRCLILVEGQTEERFVKDVLAPDLLLKGLSTIPTLLTTKVVKSGPNFKGGVTNYTKMKGDLNRRLQDSDALVTTLIDYYGLPNDTPGMSTRPNGSPRERVQHVENALREDLGCRPNFLPFLLLHEFEALLFVDHEITASVIPAREKAPELVSISEGKEPEEINELPETAPSKRLLKVFPSFRKTLHGPTAAKRIGLPRIRERCPHFNNWMSQLENFANS
ncbi:DUF4276 family protein [Roseibacillus persicicus]|uniref:DUF4276 family protein n=1 Tax=Roseibacillus persicicus TaxID=454148 RepID=UPI00280F9D4E|nr:DUF4276 family protein [Roseibacillus persicicus]MDQ8192009.1 DUF4276 family protein [Roseibacillus persicicus]